MSRTAKGLLIAAFCVLAVWAGLSTLYTYSVAEELRILRREGRSDTVYLRCRIRDLESELTAREPAEPVGGEATTDQGADGNQSTTQKPAETEPATEEVTIPTHNSPETTPPANDVIHPDTSTASPYLVAVHGEILGLFDASGALLRTANVYIMALPESDRAALTVGIPARDWEEALEILERYE